LNYKRTFAELEKKAVKWWPKELEATVAAESVIPKLIATQDRFISILKLSGDNPDQVFDVLQASGMSANLFLKHLVILTDYGGELINRLGREFTETFAVDPVTNRRVMQYVLEPLREFLSQDYQLTRNGSIILNGYDKSDGMPFDVVVEKDAKKIGIEVSFQVTTNSVIERKSGQAENRFRLMNENGFWIAYVIDGAGNFQRSSAIGTICNFSDCTVAYSKEEIAVLANFIQEKLNN